MHLELYSEKNLRQLNAIRLHFMHNAKGFWEKYRFAVYFLIIAAFIDFLSTAHFMLLWGADLEIHPHIRFMSYLLGPVWGPLTGKVYQCGIGLLGVIYIRKYASMIIWTTSALYLYAGFYNLLVSGFFDLLFIKL